MADYEVFREQLAIKYPSYGHALWEPSPTNPNRPVQVGDVGFIREGRFYRLFSALLPAGEPSQEFGVPEYHEPLLPTVSSHVATVYLGRNDYCSAGVKVEADPGYYSSPDDFPQVLFQSETTRAAAVLSLTVTARRENTLLRNVFGRWMVKHIDTWFAFARKLGLVHQMDEIILVTGCDLTRSWTNIAFLGGRADAQVSFGVEVEGSISNPSINFRFSPGCVRGAVLHHGPEGTNLPENQCVFIRGFRVAPSLYILPKRLKAAADPSPDPGSDCDSDKKIISIPAITQFRDPLHLLSDYIAEQASDCDKILVHDDDLLMIDGIGHGSLLESLEPDVMVDLLRKSDMKIHKFGCDSFLTESQIEPNTDTPDVKVAALSMSFQNWNPTHPSLWPPIAALRDLFVSAPLDQGQSAGTDRRHGLMYSFSPVPGDPWDSNPYMSATGAESGPGLWLTNSDLVMRPGDAHQYDLHIIAYTSLFRIVNNFHQQVFSDPNVPNRLNQSIDFRAVILEHDQLLTDYRQEWAEHFERDSNPNDPTCVFRVKLLPFYANYVRLVMFSFGFQKAFQRGFEPDDEVFFTRSLESAKTIVTVLIDILVPTGYIRYAPDGYLAAFASAFMLKLVRPECSRFIPPGLESEIYQVVERLINTFESPQIAIDERHTPKLYSRFLACLLAKHKCDGAAHGRMPQQGPPPHRMPTNQGAPMFQQPLQQPQASPSASSSRITTDVCGTNAPELSPSKILNSAVVVPTEALETKNSDGLMQFTFDPPVDFTFDETNQQGGNLMDFTFDPITTPSNEEMLAAMEAIQSPNWLENVLMPGFFWPAEESESMQDHSSSVRNDMVVNNYQDFQAQPAEPEEPLR